MGLKRWWLYEVSWFNFRLFQDKINLYSFRFSRSLLLKRREKKENGSFPYVLPTLYFLQVLCAHGPWIHDPRHLRLSETLTNKISIIGRSWRDLSSHWRPWIQRKRYPWYTWRVPKRRGRIWYYLLWWATTLLPRRRILWLWRLRGWSGTPLWRWVRACTWIGWRYHHSRKAKNSLWIRTPRVTCIWSRI